MNQFILDQVEFVRQGTLGLLEDVDAAQSKTTPPGFHNNILWNLGHTFLVQERVFKAAGEIMLVPDGFAKYFGGGSKPMDWDGNEPSFAEVVELLKEQPRRIREKLANRLNEELAEPFAIRSLQFKTLGELLTFFLYHEGMHTQNIKLLKQFSK